MSQFKTSATVLGLDASTQSLSAVLFEPASGKSLWQHALSYRDDARLAGLGFEHDSLLIPPREIGEAEQPPRLFVAALDALFDDLKRSGFDLANIAAINTSGQQHGHVYLSAAAQAAFAELRQPQAAKKNLLSLLARSFAYGGAPIWKTANTEREAAHMRAKLGGKAAMIAHTGSDMPLRFAAAAQRKVALRYPEAYQATLRVMQISSLIPAILSGDCLIPLDFGNACGTGLMNYQQRAWDEQVIAAMADDLPGGAAALAQKLPPLAHPLHACGTLSAYFQEKYSLSAHCKIIVGSGDNPQSKVLASGDLLSLGTSFVYMLSSPHGNVDVSGALNAMYDGLGRPFNFGCRTNGAMTWDRLRQHYQLAQKDYAACESALQKIAAGSLLRFWHIDHESFPICAANPEIQRFDGGSIDFAHDYSAIVDSALGLVYRFGQKISDNLTGDNQASGSAAQGELGTQNSISVCGGPSTSPALMARIASIWNCPAIAAGQAGAALGAALAAAVALKPEKEQQAYAETCRQKIFHDKIVTLPDPQMVEAYHAAGAYLDQLEERFTQTAQAR